MKDEVIEIHGMNIILKPTVTTVDALVFFKSKRAVLNG